jgi:hypothetical protein
MENRRMTHLSQKIKTLTAVPLRLGATIDVADCMGTFFASEGEQQKDLRAPQLERSNRLRNCDACVENQDPTNELSINRAVHSIGAFNCSFVSEAETGCATESKQ